MSRSWCRIHSFSEEKRFEAGYIIHGKGTENWPRAYGTTCAGPRVKNFRIGTAREGGSGVTVVRSEGRPMSGDRYSKISRMREDSPQNPWRREGSTIPSVIHRETGVRGGRFAAKEAFVKASGRKDIPFCHRILSNEDGSPGPSGSSEIAVRPSL